MTDIDTFEVVNDGWSKDEKIELLYAIKECGYLNVEMIQTMIPTRSVKEIESAIKPYRERAEQLWSIGYKHKDNSKPFSSLRTPLGKWSQSLSDKYDSSLICSETSSAVELISAFDRIPKASLTAKVDFRRIYHLLACVMDGKSIQCSKLSSVILKQCLKECSHQNKLFLPSATVKQIINNIKLDNDREFNSFPKYADKNVVVAIRQLAGDFSYNPLKLPEHCLKPMIKEINIETDD